MLHFISDLHLDPKRPDIQACFDQFVSTSLLSKSIDALYILGDLFEFWIGDDASIPVYQHSISQLKTLTESGIPVYVMHGNRDFLMGSDFERASGCQLIPDLYHLNIKHDDASENILLSHGDIFCTDDEYMAFRKMVREPLWQTEFLSKSIDERLAIAQSMREQSKQRGQQLNTQKQSSGITDINQKTVEDIMSEQGVTTLIHGHTHRPDRHTFQLNQQTAQRIVLPDWKPCAEVFRL